MNTNSSGNKLQEPKIFKRVKSANIRQRRILAAPGANSKSKFRSKFCSECGFRIRTKNHVQGQHHKEAVK